MSPVSKMRTRLYFAFGAHGNVERGVSVGEGERRFFRQAFSHFVEEEVMERKGRAAIIHEFMLFPEDFRIESKAEAIGRLSTMVHVVRGLVGSEEKKLDRGIALPQTISDEMADWGFLDINAWDKQASPRHDSQFQAAEPACHVLLNHRRDVPCRWAREPAEPGKMPLCFDAHARRGGGRADIFHKGQGTGHRDIRPKGPQPPLDGAAAQTQ